MNLTVGKGPVFSQHVDGTKHWVSCPRCGEYNEGGAPRCRDCMTSLLQKPAPLRAANPVERSMMSVVKKPALLRAVNPVQRGITSLVKKPAPLRAAKPMTRTVTRISTPDLDAMWVELEALTRPDEVVWFECPACESVVAGAATKCKCGAIFADPEQTVGYACPLCSRRVASSAKLCRCGARFSD